MRKFYLLISFTILLIIIPGCTHTLPLTERPCSQNITVINNEKSGDHYLISTTVTLIENNENKNRSLSLYFQKFTNKYLLSFIYSSFGSNPPGLTGVNLEFNDGTATRLKDPVYNKEMNENASDKYTITYFEIDASDLGNLCQKN